MSWTQSTKRLVSDSTTVAEIKRLTLSRLPQFKVERDIRRWDAETKRLRQQALQLFYRGIPSEWIETPPRVVWGETLHPDSSYSIRKLRYEVVPDYWIPALLYLPAKLSTPAPAILNPNGHHSGGKAATYKQIRCANLARRGALALNMEFIGMGELQSDSPHSRLALLNMVGISGVGLFLLALQKSIDLILSHPKADPDRLGITGLSGGGWQTIIATLDPRIKLAVPVAGYTSIRARVNSPSDVGDLEQIPPDMATVLDYQHLTAMFAPKPLLQITNEYDDCCFATARVKPIIVDAIRPLYTAYGAAANLRNHSNYVPGTHNYEADNRTQFYRFISRHFNLPDPGGDIHTADDIFPETSLTVGLPATQLTIAQLARNRAAKLETIRTPPRTAAERQALRQRLAHVLQLPQYHATARKLCQTASASVWQMRVGPWTIPMSLWQAKGADCTTLLIGDNGRADFSSYKTDSQANLMAVDILGCGESRVPINQLMLLETTGLRALGVQVAQILAIAEFASRKTAVSRLDIRTVGTIMPVATLLAAALKPQQFANIDSDIWFSTFRLLLEGTQCYEDIMPLCLFGLLEVADLPEIKLLLEEVTLIQDGRCLPPQ
ncbi:MAG: hypothetical protein GX230_03815 [Lentisphaerae bacterium]|nr:hypothetical protein [Lentisphaerota bacterium]